MKGRAFFLWSDYRRRVGSSAVCSFSSRNHVLVASLIRFASRNYIHSADAARLVPNMQIFILPHWSTLRKVGTCASGSVHKYFGFFVDLHLPSLSLFELEGPTILGCES